VGGWCGEEWDGGVMVRRGVGRWGDGAERSGPWGDGAERSGQQEARM